MYLEFFFLFYTETNLAICHPVYHIGTCIMSAGGFAWIAALLTNHDEALCTPHVAVVFADNPVCPHGHVYVLFGCQQRVDKPNVSPDVRKLSLGTFGVPSRCVSK